MVVGGVGSFVVEGWSSGFLVGLVLVVDQDWDFGELVLTLVGLFGDLYWVVGLVRFLGTAPIPACGVGALRVCRGGF